MSTGDRVMARHTPGPWAVEQPLGFELSIVEANKPTYEWVFIASLALPDSRRDPDAFSHKQVEANARLIAAAPDLLRACREWIEWLDAPGEGYFDGAAEREERIIADMRAAIARATGAA